MFWRSLVLTAMVLTTALGEASATEAGPRVVTILQGQSNAGLFFGNGFLTTYASLVTALTGLPCDPKGALIGKSSQENGYSIAPGHPTYAGEPGKNADLYWLAPWGSDLGNASSWPLGVDGRALKVFLTNLAPSVAGENVTVVFLRYHSESDSLAKEPAVALYPAAHQRFLSLVKEWLKKDPKQMGIFLGSPSFVLKVNPAARDMIRSNWLKTVEDPANNAHWMFGTVSDSNTKDQAHAQPQDFQMAARRTAVSVSRWLFDTGRTKKDLSWLPSLGPRIEAVYRVDGRADLLDVVIEHDKGLGLIVPKDPNLAAFSVVEAGYSVAVKKVTVVGPATIRLQLERGLTAPAEKLVFDYDSKTEFLGAGRLITDDWHTDAVAKPDWAKNLPELAELRMPLRRLEAPLSIKAP